MTTERAVRQTETSVLILQRMCIKQRKRRSNAIIQLIQGELLRRAGGSHVICDAALTALSFQRLSELELIAQLRCYRQTDYGFAVHLKMIDCELSRRNQSLIAITLMEGRT